MNTHFFIKLCLASLAYFLSFYLAINFSSGTLIYPLLTLFVSNFFFGHFSYSNWKKILTLCFLFYPFGLFIFSLLSLSQNFSLVKENTFTFGLPLIILLNIFNLIPVVVTYVYTVQKKSLDKSLSLAFQTIMKVLIRRGWLLIIVSLVTSFTLSYFWIYFVLISLSFAIWPMVVLTTIDHQ